MHDARRKAAGQHDVASHAHGIAAEHDENRENAAGRWHSKPALAHQTMLLLVLIASLAALPVLAEAQPLSDSKDSSSTDPSGAAASTIPAQPEAPYTLPTEKTKVHNYLFDAFGPYPIAGAALTAGISQVSKGIPDWKQGAAGYGRRFASDFGIAAVTSTVRYGLAEAFKQDAMYYRCDCTGVFPRLKHAVISTLTARRGADGHTVFSIPALVGPYAGTMTAVYAWYPGRYGAKDALRMGNFNLLAYMGGNIALEFLYSGPHSLLSRMHLNNGHGAANHGSNP